MDEKKIETVVFNKDDKMVFGALTPDGADYMATISGYGMEVMFNTRVINSLADAEACANALADVFYQAFMDNMLKTKPLG